MAICNCCNYFLSDASMYLKCESCGYCVSSCCWISDRSICVACYCLGDEKKEKELTLLQKKWLRVVKKLKKLRKKETLKPLKINPRCIGDSQYYKVPDIIVLRDDDSNFIAEDDTN